MCLNNSSLFVNWLYHIDSISDFQTPFESKIYTLKVTCGEYYPDKPPTARFVSKIKMTCVLDSGMVCIVILRVLWPIQEWGWGAFLCFTNVLMSHFGLCSITEAPYKQIIWNSNIRAWYVILS
jgi:ubiquitin-protein ligase